MKNVSPQFQTVLLGIFILTLVLGSLGYTVLRIQRLDRQVDILHQEQLRTETLKQQREALRNAPQETEEQLIELDVRLSNLITTPDSLDARLTLLSQLALSMNVSEDIKLDVKEQASLVGWIPFSMTIRGSLESGLDYVRELERSPYVFHVSKVSVSGVPSQSPRQIPGNVESAPIVGSGDEGDVEIQLNADLLWKP
ncbi:MAG: hypothetical protein HYZ08_01680 [Candidatus Kerfeldbacteria bacterium]|nr:hypothetical protein [Candidatus Kerfeldbacteria bacterium]